MRLSARIAWRAAKWLTQVPRTAGVTWWTAALMRFASTGQALTVNSRATTTMFPAAPGVSASFKPNQIWFKAGGCPFKCGDTFDLRGVTYVVSGFTGNSGDPIMACEVRPISEVLR